MTDRRRFRGPRKAASCIAALFMATLPALATDTSHIPPLRVACDAGQIQAVLHAAPAGATVDARAVWLSRRQLRWPGIEAGGSFRLYHSAIGAIVPARGAAVRGAAGAADKRPVEQARYDAGTRRFRVPPRTALVYVLD